MLVNFPTSKFPMVTSFVSVSCFVVPPFLSALSNRSRVAGVAALLLRARMSDTARTGKASWQDDAYMVKQLAAFQTIEGRPLGEKAVQKVTEDDLETFIKHLMRLGRSASTRNHYVQVIRAMSKWAVKKGYRVTPMLGTDSDVVRRRKEAQRHRRLEPGEEQKLLQSAEPHLQALIVAALETCCRQAELLTLRWADVSLGRGEIVIRAEHAKDRENRIIPISIRLRRVLEARRDSPAGVPFPPSGPVFGNEVGEPVGSVRRAWQTAVLRAHGHKPTWIWKKKTAAMTRAPRG